MDQFPEIEYERVPETDIIEIIHTIFEENTTISIYIQGNISINWGDGIIENISNSSWNYVTHIYLTPKPSYRISIIGILEQLNISGGQSGGGNILYYFPNVIYVRLIQISNLYTLIVNNPTLLDIINFSKLANTITVLALYKPAIFDISIIDSFSKLIMFYYE